MTEPVRVDEPPTFPFRTWKAIPPPPEFAALREREPVARIPTANGGHAWLLTRYDDICAVLNDRRFRMGFPGVPDQAGPDAGGDVIFGDAEAHPRVRRLVAADLTHRRVDRLRSFATATMTRLCDDLRADPTGRGDLVDGVALPLPIAVITELLGVQPVDRTRFRQWSDAILHLGGHESDDFAGAWGALSSYVADLVRAKRAEPGDDLLSHLVGALDEDAGRLSEAELQQIAVSVLLAGYTTTVNVLSMGMLTLLAEPGRYARLVARPDEVPATVEEILRYQSERDGLVRIATTDVPLGDIVIRTGETVVAPLSAANHDARVFDRPDGFSPDRSHNPHIAFGHGTHRCLGAALARMEIQVALTSLCENLPDLALDRAVEDLEWREDVLDAGPRSIPVRWDPAPGHRSRTSTG